MPRRVLVVGCGFVGLPLSRLLSGEGWDVTGAVHSSASLRNIHQFRAVVLDVVHPETFTSLPRRDFDVVIHAASSSRGGADAYRAVFLEGVQNLLHHLCVGHLIFTSSTSVYNQKTGEWVDESSPAEPERETGQVLRATEQSVLEAGGTVARLAGLYGPERCASLRKLLVGEAILEGQGERIMNQLQQTDAARALAHLATLTTRGIFNAVDNEPVSQRDWFEWVCSRLNRPLPPTGPRDLDRKRGWTNKRVSNAKLRQTGWKPAYPTFREGLAEFI